MITLSKHFFMEVVLNKVHSTVDKYATLNQEGTAILYTTKAQPKIKQVISLAEGKRIFEDLQGPIEQRWVTTDAYKLLALRKAAAHERRQGKGKVYGVKHHHKESA